MSFLWEVKIFKRKRFGHTVQLVSNDEFSSVSLNELPTIARESIKNKRKFL